MKLVRVSAKSHRKRVNINHKTMAKKGGKRKSSKTKRVKNGGKRKSRRTRVKNGGKSLKNRLRQKGGDVTSKKFGKFVPFKDVKNDKCTICQEDLQSSEIIKDKGIVYELTCGHQFHNNCLNRWCGVNTTKAKSDYEKDVGEEEYLRPASNFKCPVCNQTTLNEEKDCLSTDAYENDYLGDKDKYTTEEYTGIKGVVSVKGVKPEKKGLSRFLNF